MPLPQGEHLLFLTLLQLTLIVLAGRIGGIIALKVGQSVVVGEIIIGILLGPSLFGLLAPDLFSTIFSPQNPTPLNILSQIALVFLMFQIGLEFDFTHLKLRQYRQTMIAIAIACMVIPFALGMAFGYLAAPEFTDSPNRLSTALFIGTAFSITALPILGRIMIEFGMTKTPLGVIAISSAAINDVMGWILLALVSALTLSAFSLTMLTSITVGIALYVVICWLLIRPALKGLIHYLSRPNEILTGNLMGVLIALIFASAMTTQQLGVFALFGGFMMGVLLYDETQFVEAWRRKVGAFVAVFFLPVFFTYTGLRTHIGILDTPELWGWCFLLIILATVGKFGAAYVTARRHGMNPSESAALGVMMNTRALMELIVINVGLDLGVISPTLFTMLVIMAIFSTVITTPLLRRILPRQAASPILAH